VSKKSPKIAALIAECQNQSLPAHYLGYFLCFNRQLFYEAHDVLEELWLAHRHGPSDGFYKGLIQFAGAFVHLQKNRLRPAAALFRLSQSYLLHYAPRHEHLRVEDVIRMADDWVQRLEAANFEKNPLTEMEPPRLRLTLTD
jgi:predicted metal-dependent hydrolase